MPTNPQALTIESRKAEVAKKGGLYLVWQTEVEAAEKELAKWTRFARKVVKEYRAIPQENSQTDPTFQRKFNLFASNVEILQTSLINQTPEPTVDREFQDTQDDVGRVCSLILERALSSHNNRNFHTFDILNECLQDMLVPGVGCTWHTYQAETQRVKEEPTEEQLAADPKAEALEYDKVIKEEISDEFVYWEDLIWSPARSRQELRWIGRKCYMTFDQLVKRWGEEKAKKIPLNYSTKQKSNNNVEVKNPVTQQAVIYELWDKEHKQVVWYCKEMDELIEEKDDFLELDDFWPTPGPLFANQSNGSMVPIPDYQYAKDQYRGLNEINTRIALLVRACRLAGAYDQSNAAIKQVLSNAAENVLVPVDRWAAFAEKGGIKGVIDWIPLDEVIKTIDQLMKAREDLKQQIYEVTGMADIIRGASKASETLGAQRLKAQYASMRIQRRQKRVVAYTSGIFDIQTQIMRKHFDIETIQELAQVQFMDEDPNLIQQALQLIKMPEFVLRARVTSDTLSDIDFQAEKQDRMEYLQAVTGYFKEVGPTISNDPMLGPLLMHLLQFSLAGFKIGKKFEGQLDKAFQQIQQKLSQPQQPAQNPEQARAQADIQIAREEHNLDMQGKQQELNFKQKELALKLQGKQQEAQVNAQVQQQKMKQNQAAFWQKLQLDRQKAQQQAAQIAAQPVPAQTGFQGPPNGSSHVPVQ